MILNVSAKKTSQTRAMFPLLKSSHWEDVLIKCGLARFTSIEVFWLVPTYVG